MRIIGGELKGRKLQLPSKNWPVRPTTDFAREALFNILDNQIDYESATALDLFGGTGIHSIELASRGCTDITYVDKYKDSVTFMRELTRNWKLSITPVQSDVLVFIKGAQRQWSYIFADPPYDMKGIEEFPSILKESNILSENGLFVLEHRTKLHFDHMVGFRESRIYGQTSFSFFDF
jgi:16S rRNA (guanine(966)-N(2))-methyltransferase RsmD